MRGLAKIILVVTGLVVGAIVLGILSVVLVDPQVGSGPK